MGRAGVADSVLVAAAAGSDGAAVLERVRAAAAAAGLPVRDARLLAANRRSLEDHLLMAASFLLVMAQLVVAVGGLGLASTMSVAVLERTRELGVLRALGASHGTLHAVVQGEGLVVALLAWVVALPLSVPLAGLVAERFGRVFLPLAPRWVPLPGAVLAWLALSVVVSVAACAWPAVRATRVPAARALAYE
jgi:putative ABC transport system permease protein